MRTPYILLGALLSAFFIGCADNESPPLSYDELEGRIHNAIKKNDIKALESLFLEKPQQWTDARDIVKQVFTVLSESDFTTKRVEFLHSPTTALQSWSIEPEEFLRVEGANDKTAAISVGFNLGRSNGNTYIVYPSTSAASKPQKELTYYLIATPDTNLGARLPETFQSSWSGGAARSHSMDNLAASLTRFSGVNIINKTGIEGDYDFVLSLNAAKDPSNMKMDLQGIGLDLVREQEIQQAGGGQPSTRSESK
jgi:hypothetical protein